MNDTFVVKQKQKNFTPHYQHHRAALKTSHLIIDYVRCKSDLDEMCSLSKKLSRSWTALVEVVSVPDDKEYFQRLTWFWHVAVVFIFILTELTNDVALAQWIDENHAWHTTNIPPKAYFVFHQFVGNWKKSPYCVGGSSLTTVGGDKSGFWNPIEGELFSVPFHIGLFQWPLCEVS